tara:strand:- start:1181 stop:1384 length:204 start_codon:yes stop_codon:yes gene_type:complete
MDTKNYDKIIKIDNFNLSVYRKKEAAKDKQKGRLKERRRFNREQQKNKKKNENIDYILWSLKQDRKR